MAIEDDIAFLERVPTLAVPGHEALRILAISAENRYVHDGVSLFKQGEEADAAYVVQEGSFELTMPGATPTTVGAGVLVGELALITETTRSTTATAREPSTVVRIPRTLFVRMLEGYPEAAARLRDSLLAQTEQTAREMRTMRGKLGGGPGPADQE